MHSLNDIIIQIFMDRRFGVKLKDAFHFPHVQALGFRQKAVFGTVAGQLPMSTLYPFSLTTFQIFRCLFLLYGIQKCILGHFLLIDSAGITLI